MQLITDKYISSVTLDQSDALSLSLIPTSSLKDAVSKKL